jgi:hypothetical protein
VVLHKRPGIRTHRIARGGRVTVECGIPVTNPARTLRDLAEVLTPEQLERAIHEAEHRRLAPLSSLPRSDVTAGGGGRRH